MEYNVLGQPILRTTLGPTASDAFGRFRVSQPYTLFDSFHRYQDNGRINQAVNGAGSTSTHEAHSSGILMYVNTGSGHYVYRESSRAFAYQPGKSLLILQTFAMLTPREGKRTRVGYFDTTNGHYLERDGANIYFVRRSTSRTGSVEETRVAKADWNLNKLDGTDASKITLNLDSVQIMWMTIEWLGVGSVTQGFVINNQFVPCHRWDTANVTGSTTTYMATACLPVRAELENTTSTTATSSMRLICTSVISEGGYEVRGRPRSVGHTVSNPYTLGAKDTIYPVFTMRLRSTRLGGVVLPKKFTLGVGSAANYRYGIVVGGTSTGGTWVDAAADSSVQYNLTASGVSGGTEVEVGYINASNQSSIQPSLAEFPFAYQLERNTFLNTGTEFTIVCQTDTSNGPKAWCSVNWEEVT